MRYHLVTLGCPKNSSDSERLERALRRAGHVATPVAAEANAIIVNSCGFIDAAKDESASVAASLASLKRPDQELLVVGCWAQIEPQQVRARVAGVDALFGIEAWDEIVDHLGPAGPSDIPQNQPVVGGRGSAYLKISDGCARPCTFCNIPAIKGRAFRSAPIDALVLEAQRLAGEGVKELVLVAQDSTAYGDDLGYGDGLALLLERLAVEVPGVPWLRVMYAYPGFVSARLVEAMASIPQVCHYLDMPLQHASPELLKRMKRPHNTAMVSETIERLRAAMPDIAIRTTFIVGFPGETKADFETLLDFLREVRFDRASAFSYSPQAGTPAASMGNQVPVKMRERRLRRLMNVQAKISAEINASMVGRELAVLVESMEGQTTEDGAPLFVGRSYRDAPEVDGLVFCRGVARPGSMPRVRITAAMEHDLLAEPAGAEIISLTVR